MHLKDTPMRLVEPGDDEDLVPDGKTKQTICGPLVKFEPGVRRTFRPLLGAAAIRVLI